MDVTLYHNPRCSKSRKVLEILRSNDIEPRIVEYLKHTPTREQLLEILQLLALQPRDLMRKGEPAYRENNLNDPDLDSDQLLDAMLAHPILIERPIVVVNGRAIIGRPPEKVLSIL